MTKRKHVLLPILLIALVAAAAVLAVRVYDARTFSVLPTSDLTAGFENTLITTPSNANGSLTSLEFAKQLNSVRTDNKLKEFTLNQNLMTAASNLAVSYLTTGQTTVSDTDWSMISAAGYRYADANILSSSAKIVTAANAQGFFNGRNTKAVLTSDNYQDLGVAVVEGLYNGEQTHVIILMFATAASNYIPVPYDESTAPTAPDPGNTGGNGEVTPTTCNETLKLSYRQSYDNDKKAADDKLAADMADINTRYPQNTQAKQNAIAQANSQHDTSVAAAYSSYTSSLKTINCTP